MNEESEEKDAKSNCAFFRAKKRPQGARANIRARKADSSSSSSAASDSNASDSTSDGEIKTKKAKKTESSYVVKVDRKKKQKRGLESGARMMGVMESKKNVASDSSGSDDDEENPDSKVSKVSISYKNTGKEDRSGPQDMGATATLEYDTDMSRDARAIEERAREVRNKVKEEQNPIDDKVYRGMSSYARFVEKKDSVAGSAAKLTGPQRAPANIRATVRWDYEPAICKDYKETGFCGFGDSCKFMHDRTDYKLGWQLEREMQEGTYGNDDDDHKYEISSDDDDLPFKCFICKDSFVNPVVTKCLHYFCEKCALGHYRKSQRCYACGKQTNGVFNPAKNLIEKLEKQKAKEMAKEDEKPVEDFEDD